MARTLVTIGLEKVIFPYWRSALDVLVSPWLNVGVVENPPYGGPTMVRMRTNAEKNRDDLDAAYVESYAAVMRYLDKIQNLVHDLPAPESDGLNWAHVGDMNKVKTDLQEIARFLSGTDQ
jgi:hypothetical protein